MVSRPRGRRAAKGDRLCERRKHALPGCQRIERPWQRISWPLGRGRLWRPFRKPSSDAGALKCARRGAFDGEETADVFPEELREALVEVGADGDVALVAGVVGRKFGDHAIAVFQCVALELHGAGLQGAIGGDYEEAQSGFAAGGAVVGEILARGLERTGRIDDPVGGVAALFDAIEARVELGKLFGQGGEVLAAAGAARRGCAVTEIPAPLAGFVRDGLDLSAILAGDATVEYAIVVTQLGQAGDQIFEMAVEAGVDSKGIA